MRASILIGVHNEGDRLWKTVESVLETIGRLDAEVLVSDDGSTDGSVSELKRRFPRIAVVEGGPRIGVGAARGLGADRARGNVLIFLDGHTKPEAGALERLVSSVEKTRGEAVITPQIVGLDEASWKSLPQQIGHGYALDLETFDSWWLPLKKMREVKEAQRTFFESPALVGCALAVSRELYDRLWGFDPHMRQWGNEDLDFALKAWTMGARVLHDPEATVAHRFQRDFADYEVNAEYPLANQIRSARKHFTQSVWEEWVTGAAQQQRQRLKGHPEGLWASAWEIFQKDRASAEHERIYLLARRTQDEFWFAKRFDRSWPNIGSGATLLTQAAIPPHVLFAKPMATPPPPPQVDSIDPDNACSGVGRISGVISGTNLGGATVTGSGPISVEVGSATNTTIDVTFDIGAFQPGTYDITVTTPEGSDTGEFTVNPMSVGGIDPESGCLGDNVTVTITGTCFLSPEAPPTVTGDGVTVGDVSLVDGQTITASLAIDSTATPGSISLTVKNSNGEGDSDTADFTIDGVTGIEPESGLAGSTVSITISGYGLAGATLSAPNITFSNIDSSSDTTLTADMTIPFGPTGQINITVTEEDGCTDTAQFVVLYPASVTWVSDNINEAATTAFCATQGAPSSVGWHRNVNMQVLDQNGNPFTGVVNLTESFVASTPNDLGLGLPVAAIPFDTGADGKYVDDFFVCANGCPTATGVTNVIQYHTASGQSTRLNGITITYACGSILIGGN